MDARNSKVNKTINSVYEEPQEENRLLSQPSLVVFPFNHPKTAKINDETDWVLCEKKNKKLRKDNKLLFGQNDKLTYEAKSKLAANNSEFIVGVYSKKKRHVKFVDIDSIFCVSQKIRRVEEGNSNKEKALPKKFLSDYQENNIQLKNDFGTTKVKKAVNNAKSNVVSEGNISSLNAVKQIFEEKAAKHQKEVEMNHQQQKENKFENWVDILPNFEPEATKVNEIFAIDSIFDMSIGDKINLQNHLDMFKDSESKNANKPKFSSFVFNKLSSLIKDGTTKKPVKVKCFIFLEYLIKFHLLGSYIRQNTEHLSRDLNMDLELADYFLKSYAEPNFHKQNENCKFVKTKNCELKIIYHILIFCLYLNGYAKFDYTDLAQSMKLETKKIHHYLKEIGCKFTSNKKGNKEGCVELTAPLKLNVNLHKQAK